jgi:glycosyltransferase involved in cell wall biosynthesis
MSVAALSHGYPPAWNMGGEVSLHRTLKVLPDDKFVLTSTPQPYTIDGVHVRQIDTPDVLNRGADPQPIAEQLRQMHARTVVAQNELSLPGVLAATMVGATSIVSVHTPPRYGAGIRGGVLHADHAIYNTRASAKEWGEPEALVVHPPISPPPATAFAASGDAYTLLSSLLNKGVEVVLELAARLPRQRFIIVRSPAEPTHGLKDLEQRAAMLPNVELHPRVTPDEVATAYLIQTRILLVPSRYETYGMSAIEAAGYGIPTVHVDTPHVREGIGDAAELVAPLSPDQTQAAIQRIESDYLFYSARAQERAHALYGRQAEELAAWVRFVADAQPLTPRQQIIRQHHVGRRGRR